MVVRGAAEHNLQGIDVTLPLNRLVVLAGVSGSGKSTLLDDILHRALARHFGKGREMPGRHAGIDGVDALGDVVFVDQSAIGKSARSNPASYVGAFDAIRKRFAAEPLAKERGYTTGTFSFNTGNGRCPECGGTGFEHVEMQFLSDVYLRCGACDGRRYRPEILEVTIHGDGAPPSGYSIADVLDLTVDDALAFFKDHADVRRALAPLIDVGLGYLTLGQPVPTLSGGEAQRLKLAKFLAEKPGRDQPLPKLFLFDEPTTGLHFQDIDRLLDAFNQLLAAGHSLVVIEHNLDVLAAADWIIELGPDGGAAGGQLVDAGAPESLAARQLGPTGYALADAQSPAPPDGSSVARRRKARPDAINVIGARENNLKAIDVAIPRNRFSVISGVSGSGKSTLAFDILFAEGQRRYLESLNAYARQFVQPAARPDIDAVTGVPPTVAIEQRTSRGGRKSTVGTMTEALHFLRLLFVRLGTWYCPGCNVPIEAQSADSIVAQLLAKHRNQQIRLAAPLVVGRKGYYTDLATWAAKKGFTTLRVDGTDIETAAWPRLSRYKPHDIDLPIAKLRVSAKQEGSLREALTAALGYGKNLARVTTDDGVDTLYSTERACPSCQRSFPEPDPRQFSFNSPVGWCPTCEGAGADWLEDEKRYAEEDCATCDGERLNDVARAVRFAGYRLPELTRLSIDDLTTWIGSLSLGARERDIAAGIVAELGSRLDFLKTVGLGYLSLDRAAPSLSGGEAQRIRLAAQLGASLRDVCYVLDEPTIGLHARDNARLLGTLRSLADQGNTVVVVEHDAETIEAADYNIDIGPGAGRRGGEVLAAGTLRELKRARRSLTAKSLAEPMQHPSRGERRRVALRSAKQPRLKVTKATRNNLKRLSVQLPLDVLVGISGVSGSGKSTLIREIVATNIARRLAKGGTRRQPTDCAGCDDGGHIDRLLEVDQTPIGKTPRSCPATYIGFWDEIRRLYAETPEARMRGYTASRFSFNVAEGRCPACDGQGMLRLEMSFLPDVRVPCEVCGGQRFNPETLAVTYRDRTIGEVLAMDVATALQFFEAVPKIERPLALMADLGLDYLTLGQQSPTLSGGEAQRIKLVSELAKARPVDETRASGRAARTLYILDEPTIGLHMADVGRLVGALHRLVDAGHSVLVIEHNLDVLAEADWLIDLGPEGGNAGGKIVFQGPPEQLLHMKLRSHTANSLAKLLDKPGLSN